MTTDTNTSSKPPSEPFISPVVIIMWIFFCFILILLAFVLSVILLPYKFYLICTRNSPESKISVQVHAPEGEKKDDLLFIHGWPDCAALWDG